MASTTKLAFTPANLAVPGALDDFRDVYCAIELVYDKQRKIYIDQNGSEKTLWPMDLD